jgi:serine/threonine-protein kinase
VLHGVPQLAGGTLDAAKSALNGASLALGTVTEKYDDASPAGTVLGQDPAKGTALRGATPVNLVVSKGPQPIPVPQVVGAARDAAAKTLTDAGLTPSFAPDAVNDKTIPAGSVVSQDPSTGTLAKGGTVTLTLSKGPKMVHVPNYIGKQADKAARELRSLGFDVKINNILGGFFGTVRDQNPVDQDAPEGSTITLTVV